MKIQDAAKIRRNGRLSVCCGVFFVIFAFFAVFATMPPAYALQSEAGDEAESPQVYGPPAPPNFEPWAYLAYVSILDHTWLDNMKRDQAAAFAATFAAEEPENFPLEAEMEAEAEVKTVELLEIAPPEVTADEELEIPVEDEAEEDITEDFTEEEEEDENEDFTEDLPEDDQDEGDFFEDIPTEDALTDEEDFTDKEDFADEEDFTDEEKSADEEVEEDVATEEDAANEEDAADQGEPAEIETKTEPEPTSQPESPPVPPLTEAEETLSARLQRTLEIYREISMATDENRPSDIMMFAIPFGCKVAVYEGCREAEEFINAIGALCWNYPMREQLTFNPAGERLLPNLGYGVQHYPGQLLATFALSRVAPTYQFPARSAQTDAFLEKIAQGQRENVIVRETSSVKPARRSFTVMDLVAYEQQRCRMGADLSYTLIGLSYYLPPDAVWQDAEGNRWSLEKLLYHELKRRPNIATVDITNHLLGISCAVRCRQQRVKEETSQVYLAAEKYLADFREFALANQNEWHCWHPRFFARRGVSNTQRDSLFFASAHILRWLVVETPREELSDIRLQNAMDILERFAYDHLSRWDPCGASSQEIEGVIAALHAMMLYERRYFAPRKMALETIAPPVAAPSPD